MRKNEKTTTTINAGAIASVLKDEELTAQLLTVLCHAWSAWHWLAVRDSQRHDPMALEVFSHRFSNDRCESDTYVSEKITFNLLKVIGRMCRLSSELARRDGQRLLAVRFEKAEDGGLYRLPDAKRLLGDIVAEFESYTGLEFGDINFSVMAEKYRRRK